MNEKNSSRYFSKNLLRLKNGYVLEFNHNKPGSWLDEKNIFLSFFNEFDGHYVVQELIDYLHIRRDKDRERTSNPYIKKIYNKSESLEKVFDGCLLGIDNLVEKSNFSEKDYDRKEICVDKYVQDYLHEDLYTFLEDPIFNWPLNGGTKNKWLK